MAEGLVKRRSRPPKEEGERAVGGGGGGGGKGAKMAAHGPSLTVKYAAVFAFGLACLSPYLYLFFFSELDHSFRRAIVINFAMSFVGLVATVLLIPIGCAYVLKKNMFGYDLNKKGSPAGLVQVPESMGLASGLMYLIVMILFQHFYFTRESEWLVQYNAALASICFMLFLGFMDDVFDLPWRVKLVLPSFAALPLLMAYAGGTTIVVPKPLQGFFGFESKNIGWLYKVYMGLMAVFCTNSINILAGINGLEVGQTIIIGCAVLIHNIMQIQSVGKELREAHAFSIYLMQPLVATSLGLLAYNWYPSSVFVGDTYTYFAGMTLAVVGILGHFSETLILFLVPQGLNFLYSLPQLLKIVPCPRHRLPIFDPQTGLLTGTKDMNLVNFFLRVFGRCTEQQLLIRLLLFQVLCCALGFYVRFIVTGWYK